MALAGVRHTQAVPAWVTGRVEMVLGHVDPDRDQRVCRCGLKSLGRVHHLFHVLCLSSEARPQVSVQGARKRRGGHTVSRPIMAHIVSTLPLPVDPRWPSRINGPSSHVGDGKSHKTSIVKRARGRWRSATDSIRRRSPSGKGGPRSRMCRRDRRSPDRRSYPPRKRPSSSLSQGIPCFRSTIQTSSPDEGNRPQESWRPADATSLLGHYRSSDDCYLCKADDWDRRKAAIAGRERIRRYSTT